MRATNNFPGQEASLAAQLQGVAAWAAAWVGAAYPSSEVQVGHYQCSRCLALGMAGMAGSTGIRGEGG